MDAPEKKDPPHPDHCAEELAGVNEELAHEIDERARLALELKKSNLALSRALDAGQALEQSLAKSHDELVDTRVEAASSRHLSLHDALTGLPNASLFQDRLHLALAQAKRHGWRLAVMFIDIDKFKTINDTYGHDLGDRVLRGVGQRLKALVRGGDTVSRRGGDEFLFLMLEAKDESNAETLASKIIHAVAEACEFGGVTLSIRFSIGIAVYPEDGGTAAELLRNADAAMYLAKQERKGTALFSQTPPALS